MNPLLKKILWSVGTTITVGTATWKAIPFIAEVHQVVTELPAVIDFIDSARIEKQNKVFLTREVVRQSAINTNQDAKIDSLKIAIEVLKVGKEPMNQVWFYSRRDSVYKVFHISTPWIWRKRE